MLKSLIVSSAFILLLSSQEYFHGQGTKISDDENPYFSPCDLTIDTVSGSLFVLGKTAHELRSYPLEDFSTYSSYYTRMPPKSIGLAGDKLLLVSSHSEGWVEILRKSTLKPLSRIKVGHGACDVEISPDLSTAFVANQYSDDISVLDLESNKEKARIKVLRQPKQITLSKDGRYLFAANFLPAGRADADTVTSAISVIEVETQTCVKHIPLANGSNALRGMCLSADGEYILVTHNLGRFQLPTTQLEQGWMNTSALSIIHVNSREYVATILLDEPDRGAAGSWGLACTAKHVFVAHSGTHDFSTIDFRALMDKLREHPDKPSLAYDLTFLQDIRERTSIAGNGPRAIAVSAKRIFLANYFSDNLNAFSRDNSGAAQMELIELSDWQTMDPVRKGEQYFHDATFCFQSWQSCTGCHPDDARIDGLNWDLLNDGMGNPRNCKSLLLAHRTSPSMITGIRPNAETAVKAGFEYIQFMKVDDSISSVVDKYLSSLDAVPSPHLIQGELGPKARKGREVFERVACQECHPDPLFTDQKKHSMGSRGIYDRQNSWDTPTLIEIWRTGPYMHDGRCATLEEVFAREMHGLTQPLPEEQLQQLVAYMLSL